MSITTTSLLSAPVQASFSMRLLSVPVPYMIHSIPADLKNMPKNGGTTLRMRRYQPLNTAPVPLGNSGFSPPPQVLSAVNIDAIMSFYGTYVMINEQVTLQAQDRPLTEAAARLGVSLRQTEDLLIRNVLESTSGFINCVSGVNADNPTEITRNDIDLVIRTLRGNSAYSFISGIPGENRFGTAPVRDAYFAMGHTDLIGQLENCNGFIQKWNYPNQQSTLEAEHGAVANLRFLLSPVGSTTPSASLLGATVYNVFCTGREAYATINMDSYSNQFIYLPPQFSGPLMLNSSAGYKFAAANTILNDQWIFNLRCTLA